MNVYSNPSFERIKTKSSELIGDTPLLELSRTGSGSRLLLKLNSLIQPAHVKCGWPGR